MVILLQINKITFEKNENLEKKLLIYQNLPKIVRENCFLNCPGENGFLKS